jgi:hypothetical protein
MDELFPKAAGPLPVEPEGTEHVDPLVERRLQVRPWELRSAQWRAWALAEEAFGSGVLVHLSGQGGYQGIRGLLTMTVPFQDLADHRGREQLFMAWASRDPILTRVPVLFVFQPHVSPTPTEAPSGNRKWR